jgi:hypothetical protein
METRIVPQHSLVQRFFTGVLHGGSSRRFFTEVLHAGSSRGFFTRVLAGFTGA